MPKISTKVTFHKAAAKARIKAAADYGLTIMGFQALEDTTQHVPKDQGLLQDSGLANSSKEAIDLTFVLCWAEPYSQYLFHGEVMHGNPTNRTYGPENLSFTSTMAKMEWTKYAEKVYGSDWKRVYQAAMQRRLKE